MIKILAYTQLSFILFMSFILFVYTIDINHINENIQLFHYLLLFDVGSITLLYWGDNIYENNPELKRDYFGW